MTTLWKIYLLTALLSLLAGGVVHSIFPTDDETRKEKSRPAKICCLWETVFIPKKGKIVTHYLDKKEQAEKYARSKKQNGVVIYRDLSNPERWFGK